MSNAYFVQPSEILNFSTSGGAEKLIATLPKLPGSCVVFAKCSVAGKPPDTTIGKTAIFHLRFAGATDSAACHLGAGADVQTVSLTVAKAVSTGRFAVKPSDAQLFCMCADTIDIAYIAITAITVDAVNPP